MSDCPRPVLAVVSDASVFRHSYPGERAQVGQARRDVATFLAECPVADSVVLLVSEVCSNAVLHRRSGTPGGRFTVRVEARSAGLIWAGVEDQGGSWIERAHGDGRMHGLDIVRMLAGDW